MLLKKRDNAVAESAVEKMVEDGLEALDTLLNPPEALPSGDWGLLEDSWHLKAESSPGQNSVETMGEYSHGRYYDGEVEVKDTCVTPFPQQKRPA